MDRKKTVLIVEDEKSIVDILRFNLEKDDYAVETRLRRRNLGCGWPWRRTRTWCC